MKNTIVKIIIAIVVIGVLVGFNMLMNNNTNVKHDEGEEGHDHGGPKILDATLEMDKVCVVETNEGTFEFVLLSRDIPNSTKAIKKLIGKKAYNDVKFSDVKDWCVKTDFATSDMEPLENESAYGISSCRGAVLLAKGNKTMKNVSSFVVIKETSPSMAEYFTIIGYVVKGMDVVDKIKVDDSIKTITFRKSTKDDEKTLVDLIKKGTEDSMEVSKASAKAQEATTKMGMPH